jgi:hypothetical protein
MKDYPVKPEDPLGMARTDQQLTQRYGGERVCSDGKCVPSARRSLARRPTVRQRASTLPPSLAWRRPEDNPAL